MRGTTKNKHIYQNEIPNLLIPNTFTGTKT